MSREITTRSPFTLIDSGKNKEMLFNLLHNPLERVLQLKGCGRLYDDISRNDTPAAFMEALISALNVTTDLTEAGGSPRGALKNLFTVFRRGRTGAFLQVSSQSSPVRPSRSR